MIKIGITGQAGFVGTHLFNTLSLLKEEFEPIPFQDAFFDDKEKFNSFVKSCDVIVHLAAMNRHNDPEVIYSTNIRLVKQLIEVMEQMDVRPHVLFSSSTQEERDNLYGKSKKEGRELFENWALRNNACFTGLVIPNVFGPFGRPYYNSFIATFCHQLTHGEQPKIETDGTVKLIYVAELVSVFINNIRENSFNSCNSCSINTKHIPHTSEGTVSEILTKLKQYKSDYFENGTIPNLTNTFDRNLWNTFLCYIDLASFFPFFLKQHTDQRGSFVETMKLQSGGQISFSTTKPGITRGNHFHTRKAERFAVIKGKARIQLRRIGTEDILNFELSGNHPSFVDMPVWYTHNITNTGNEDLYTIFWISEFYDSADPDTFFETV